MKSKVLTLEDKIKNVNESILICYQTIEEYRNKIEDLHQKIYEIENYELIWSKQNLIKLIQEQQQNNK